VVQNHAILWKSLYGTTGHGSDFWLRHFLTQKSDPCPSDVPVLKKDPPIGADPNIWDVNSWPNSDALQRNTWLVVQ